MAKDLIVDIDFDASHCCLDTFVLREHGFELIYWYLTTLLKTVLDGGALASVFL